MRTAWSIVQLVTPQVISPVPASVDQIWRSLKRVSNSEGFVYLDKG